MEFKNYSEDFKRYKTSEQGPIINENLLISKVLI